MRIGITGASGLIGRAIIAEAVKQEHEIVAFSRNPSKTLPGTVDVRDFSDPEKSDFTGLDAVIHLAGESVLGFWTEKKKERILSSRVEGTRGLVRALEKLPAKKRPGVLVCASGVGFYGDNGDSVLDEDSDAGFGFLAQVVREWEHEASEAERIGLRVVYGRTGMVLGKEGGAAKLLRRVFGFCLGGRIGPGDQWMSWGHVDDVARMYLSAVTDENCSGPMNFVAPNPVTNREFTETISRVMGRPAIFPVPSFILRRMGGIDEMFLYSQRATPANLELAEFVWVYPHLEKALTEALEKPVKVKDQAESGGTPENVVDLGKPSTARESRPSEVPTGSNRKN